MVLSKTKSDPTRARDLLALMTATLDRERPRWRVLPGPAAPGPGDDREAVRRIAVGALRMRFNDDEPLHLHPELLSTATDAEIELLALAVDAPDGQSSGVRAMRRLRRLSAAMRVVAAVGGAPFALQLRRALDCGNAHDLVTAISEDGDAREASRFVAALAGPVSRKSAIERFLGRLALDADTDVAEELRLSARTTSAFAASICGDDPSCDRCALATARLCASAFVTDSPAPTKVEAGRGEDMGPANPLKTSDASSDA